ncbi:MAG TPA: energy-coupling factor transporter ATPase [Candidatus Avidehalobacter gallistercoris]|uniref:Energy-coupling factor transporter ATPase n=1 Tax=Candidatus Avidehalobacter gallistercoris TaxID=2840694 RepID=A0A9D1HIZ2_9FIRM|nr:energy-coupling factor transporter ATPase [Candidatus Avidehalobacter gallistercoris]
MFQIEKLQFKYENGTKALDGVTLSIKRGEWFAVLGANGSGKSTLARHLNGLLLAASGRVLVDGREVGDYSDIKNLRRMVGLVFQNPDNQIVGNSVEEDVAFGLENLGVPRDEMRRRITEVLGQVGLAGLEQADPATLSGGQKQRLAIAGALAMQPQALILDEATAMLDPAGAAEVLSLLGDLHRQGLTIVMITHNMSEVVAADRAAVLSNGQLVFCGTPQEVFAAGDMLRACHLELPPAAALGEMLGIPGCMDLTELLERLQVEVTE